MMAFQTNLSRRLLSISDQVYDSPRNPPQLIQAQIQQVLNLAACCHLQPSQPELISFQEVHVHRDLKENSCSSENQMYSQKQNSHNELDGQVLDLFFVWFSTRKTRTI